MEDETTFQPTTPTPTTPLTYEETPVITPIEEQQGTTTPPPPPAPKTKSGVGVFMRNLIIFMILFGVGFVLSGYVRNLFTTTNTEQQVNTTITPTVRKTETINNIPTISQDPTATWSVYPVLNGTTRKAIEGITYKLPSSVLAPICDGSACGSQGTYLPGGTRFTVAARGSGQVLADFRGKVISDVSGKAFTVKQTLVGSNMATEFTTNILGSTIGGYAFSRMRGYMIELSDTLSLEINHFTPNGIAADFEKDDVMFEQIVKTIVVPGTTQKGSVIATPTATIKPTLAPTTPVVATPTANP